jgi:hypothetical protein
VGLSVAVTANISTSASMTTRAKINSKTTTVVVVIIIILRCLKLENECMLIYRRVTAQFYGCKFST